jgi:hypothetical protein
LVSEAATVTGRQRSLVLSARDGDLTIASLIERLEVRQDILDLIGLELEYRHHRMDPLSQGRCRSETGYLTCKVRNGGAFASGLGLTLSTA